MKKQNQYSIIFDLKDVLFALHSDHPNAEKMFTVIKKGLELLLKCYAPVDEHGKRRHKLYVLSNANHEFHHYFLTQHAEIFSHFDGIVTRSTCGYSKPDAKAFYHIIERYQLDPKTCIFIDDKKVNVLTAQAVGMHGIVCDDHNNVITALKKLNVF